METKLHRTLVTVGEVSGKIDILNMNMSKLMRVVIPSEKRISRPERMPTLPLDTKQDLKEFEKFLETDSNLAAAVNMIYLYRYLLIKKVSSTYKFLLPLHYFLFTVSLHV
jgi:hypothetical protein